MLCCKSVGLFCINRRTESTELLRRSLYRLDQRTGAPFLGLKLLVDHDATGVAREVVTAIAEPAWSGQLPLV